MEDCRVMLGRTRLLLTRGNIVEQNVEAIVNAANSGLLGGGGVDGAIHRAGGPQILEECKVIRAQHGPCAPGKAVITGGGNLPAKWVIHAVGPVWRGGDSDEQATLAGAYRSSLDCARQVEARSVAFPSISTGAYSYPVDLAADTALAELQSYSATFPDSFEEIRFVLFDEKTFDAYKAAWKRLN